MSLRRIKNPRSFELCRTCLHYFISHVSISDDVICQWMNNSYSPHSCSCKEFLPKDNLEYLEWEYGKLDKKFSS